MSDVVIRAENLSKRYRLGEIDPHGTFREMLRGCARLPGRMLRKKLGGNGKASSDPNELWALKDVSFEVKRGEVVGVIGRNGAGKSTLLKLLTRITRPTTGRIELHGRVGSLLEVGTGFHPELTGRENIFLNGAILGMARAEIRRKFDEIVEFSGVSRFLDTPVKRYSSGMRVRLAFAVAAHLDPEILLIDEVLAVGDAEFQKKCLGKMDEVARAGRTVLFVSHNMAAVRSLTKQCMVLTSGILHSLTRTSDAIQRYLEEAVTARTSEGGTDLAAFRRDRHADSPVRIVGVSADANANSDAELAQVQSGDELTLWFDVEATRQVEAQVTVGLVREDGNIAVTLYSLDSDARLPVRPGLQRIACSIGGMPLTPGRYLVHVGITENPNARAFDVIRDYPAFEVHWSAIHDGTLHWTTRPWGAVHWDNVRWNVSDASHNTLASDAETDR